MGNKSNFAVRHIKLIKNDFKMNKAIWVMALPVFLYYLIFKYLPMYGIIIAFKDFNIARGIQNSTWVGLNNFTRFFKGHYFPRLLRNTVTLSLGQLIFGFPAPIILALLLNEVNNMKFKRSIQTITYLPHFISLVVVCGMIVDFFSRDGLVNKVLSVFNVESIPFLIQPKYFKPLYIGSGVWQQAGWGSIIYLSALSQIDLSLYEACTIDGGGRWKQFVHITFPQILPTVIILLILNLGRLMSQGAEKVILLYNPSTFETADIFASYVYRRGLQEMNYSFAAAVELFNNVINCALLVATNTLSRRTSEISLW